MIKFRLEELDVFRGVAALIVVIYHYTTRFNEKYVHSDELLFELPLKYFGVDFFFVVSGFVIFMTINRTNKSMDFVVSRFSRLFPAYWLAIILTTIVMLTFGLPDKTLSISQVLVNFTMLQEFMGVEPVDSVYWTLTRELIFYASILIIYKLGFTNRIIPIISIWLLIQLFSELMLIYTGYFPWKITFLLNLEYANLFGAGIVFYLLKTKPELKYLHYLIALCLINYFIRHGLELGLLTGLIYASFYLFIYGKLSFICVKPLIFLGTISYSLYLIHENIGFIIIRLLSDFGINSNIAILATIFMSIILASTMTYKIERPANVWLRNRYKNRLITT